MRADYYSGCCHVDRALGWEDIQRSGRDGEKLSFSKALELALEDRILFTVIGQLYFNTLKNEYLTEVLVPTRVHPFSGRTKSFTIPKLQKTSF